MNWHKFCITVFKLGYKIGYRMLHQKMIGWTVPACRDADQQKMLPLNNLAQFIARLEGNEPAWISVRTAAYLIQTKIDVFKKLYFGLYVSEAARDQ